MRMAGKYGWRRATAIASVITAMLLTAACRSNKELQQQNTVEMDSVARSQHHSSIAVADSVIRSVSFVFDTIEINIQRPVAYATAPEVIRLKAVKGSVTDKRREHRDSVESYNALDTVAYHRTAAEASTEHTTTTRLYNPPDGTAVIILAIIAFAVLVYIFHRK